MRSLVVVVVVVVVVVAIAGCGRLGFDASSATATGDAPPGTGDAAPFDDAANEVFCTTFGAPVVLCDDFASGTTVRWDGIDLDAQNTLDASSHQLRVDVAAVAANAATNASIFKDALPAPVASVAVGFDYHVDVVGTSDLVLAELDMNDGTTLHDLNFVQTAFPDCYVEDVSTPVGSTTGQYADIPFTGPDPAAAWHRASMTYYPPTHMFELRIDGNIVAATPTMWTTAGAVSLGIGVEFLGGPAAAWSIREDNVTVEIH